MSHFSHRRLSRVVALAAAGTSAVLVLAGCSGAGDPDSSGAQEFSFAFPVSGDVESPYEALANQYMEENENVTITLNALPLDSYPQTLRTQMNAGNAPDVFQTIPGSGQGNSILTLAEAGLLEPLGEATEGLIPNGNEALFQIDGETYGQALSISFSGNVVNATAAEAAGVEFPTDWESLLEACSVLRAQGMSLFVVAGAVPPGTGYMAMNISASRVYADDPDWNQQRADGDVTFAESEGWQDTLETILELKEAGCLQDGVEGAGFDAITGRMSAGTSLAIFAPSGAWSDLGKAVPGSNFVVEPFPAESASAEPFGIANAAYSLSLAASSENKDAVKAFLEWMAQPEQSKQFADAQGSLPITGLEELDLTGTPYAGVAEILTSGSYVALPNATWPNESVYDALATGVQGLLTGQKTVDDVLTAMDAAWG